MNNRERYIATAKFMTQDKIPFTPGHPREKTIKRWISEGMDPNNFWFSQVLDQIGITTFETPNIEPLGVSFIMKPTFEEKVLEHKNGHYIVRDWMGAITEISDEYDYTYIREAKDFVTRKWHKFPIVDNKDFEDMKKRYDIGTVGRFPDDLKNRCSRLKNRTDVLSISFNGPFWQLREWCGFEGLCMMMIENSDFVIHMMAFWKDFVSRVLDRILDNIKPDRVFIQEDMAYKSHSMISPEMTRKYLKPCYDEWIPKLKNAGVSVIEMDSDGYVGELIPIWIESKIDICSPVEVAANNDIVLFRDIYQKKMAFSGGVDKRCIAKGGQIIIDEMNRLAPVIKSGGFIPSCDHGVPHDISWQNYIEYGKILAKLTGWI